LKTKIEEKNILWTENQTKCSVWTVDHDHEVYWRKRAADLA
jgi:hypothetical protein